MVLRAITSDYAGAGVRVEMANRDLLLVTEDAVVVRTDAADANEATISALENNNILDIRGGVTGGGVGIRLGNDQNDDWDYSVKLGPDAFVKSFWGTGIRGNAIGVKIINAGEIQGRDGIELNGTRLDDLYKSHVVNSGLIEGEAHGIVRSSVAREKVLVENTGVISGKQFSFSALGANAVEHIINKGKMIGDIWLDAGADVYDGRGGTLQGYVIAGDGDDTLYGGAGIENFNGGAGKDFIDGGAGNDNLFGGEGNDVLKGGSGNDFLAGEAGNDRMEGGQGNDTYSVDAAGDVVVERAGEGLDKVAASVSHTLSANIEQLYLAGSANLAGTGNNLANVIVGNSGKNTLKGMAGNDKLEGGGGADKLYGGSGKDTFVFASAADSKMNAQDKIFDFSARQGDRFDLRGVDANSGKSGNQAFSFIGKDGFHEKAGELRFYQKSSDTFVQGDINGDGVADFGFVLDATVNLKSSDFLL